MKKMVGVVAVIILMIVLLFQLYKQTVSHEYENYLSGKYHGEAFEIGDVHCNLRKHITSAKITSHADRVIFTIEKTGTHISDNYLDVKYTKEIHDQIESVLSENQLRKYVKTIIATITQTMDYESQIDDVNPKYNLLINYNLAVKNDEMYAEIAFKMIEDIKNSPINNVDTFLFTQEREGKGYELTVYSNEIPSTLEEIKREINTIEHQIE